MNNRLQVPTEKKASQVEWRALNKTKDKINNANLKRQSAIVLCCVYLYMYAFTLEGQFFLVVAIIMQFALLFP